MAIVRIVSIYCSSRSSLVLARVLALALASDVSDVPGAKMSWPDPGPDHGTWENPMATRDAIVKLQCWRRYKSTQDSNIIPSNISQ